MTHTKKIKQNVNTNNKYYDLDGNLDSETSIKKIILTIIGVAIFFGAIYGFTVLVLNKGEKRQPVGEPSISYQKIIAGSALTQQEDSYVVLFFTENNDIYEAMTEYRSGGKNTIYYVDLKDGLNKYTISDNVNVNVSSASDLRVKDPTLIKVTKGKVTDYRVGKKNILDYLK